LCGGITVFNPLAMHAKPTDRVGIIGIGGLGHLAVKFAAAYGCDVTAFTSSESKFDEARGFGANHVVSSRDSAAIKKLAGSFDLLISTVNVTLDWDAMINALAPDGRLHVVGGVVEPIPRSRVLPNPSAAQRLRVADRLARGDSDDARLRCASQHRAADRAFPDEPDRRCDCEAGIR
jgi:D-arabinose 1-dehydrogenase-like Zn-dependent alcohol dehydrogenase